MIQVSMWAGSSAVALKSQIANQKSQMLSLGLVYLAVKFLHCTLASPAQ